MASGGEAGPYFFPAPPPNAIELRAKRVLVVACHHSLWVGNTFNDYRDSVDAKRAHALLMFVVEATLKSKNVGMFETVYDDVYNAIGMQRVAFVRFWVILTSDERTDAFNAQCLSMLAAEPDDGKAKGSNKRKRIEEPAPMGAHLLSCPGDMAKALVQQRMSHVDEPTSVTFDHAGAITDIGAAFDVADDEGEDANGAGARADVADRDDPSTSLVARLAAASYFDHNVTSLALESNRVSAADRRASTYMTVGTDGMTTFHVIADDRLSRMRLIDARVTSKGAWLDSAQQLLQFKLPQFVPSHHELLQWVLSQASVVGITMSELETMEPGELREHVNELMLCPATYAPIPEIAAGVSSGASSWSECRYEEVYPSNAAWMSECRRDMATIRRSIASGALPASERRYNDEHVINELNMFTSGPLNGWPDAYARVRGAVQKDILKFNEMASGASEFGRDTSLMTMFIGDACPDDMTLQTFCMVQFVELMRCEFGLDRPQSHMNAVIYPWAFVLLVPAFGYPGSIQARGPPGSGKGEAKKRLQPCVSHELWFSVDSFSDQSTTYGIKGGDQCFWDMDENTSQGKQAGSTLTQQTTDSNGISKRARANADTGVTDCVAHAVRHVSLGSYNVPLNEAMNDRSVDIDLPRSMGEVRTNMTPCAPYIAAVYRILTGLSTWVWLYNMAGMFTFEETVMDMFYGLNTVILPESKLATHARTKEAVRILAMGITVFEIVSMYYRRTRKPLSEDGSYAFLTFVRDNAVLSPTAIWQSYLLITTGQDPRRDPKVLSIFKDNLRRRSGGTYETSEDDLYYVTTFVKPSADVEPKAFVRAANACGLGQAIATEGLSHLLQVKDAATGHPILRLHTETAGSARQRYHVLITAVTTLAVLTDAETAILECLSKAIADKLAFISADETQYVFKENVRSSILTPKGSDPMLKFGRRDIMAADDLLQRVPGLGYESASGLLKDVAVAHPTQLATSQLAEPGGPLDPDSVGVYYGVMPYGQVIAVDIEGIRLYEAMRDGTTRADTDAEASVHRLGSLFFKACGAKAGERVFAGVGGADDVHALYTLPVSEGAGDSVHIHNPRYTQRANRLTKSVADPDESVLFPRDHKTVRIHEGLQLCRKINAYNGRLYGSSASTAYNYP